MKALELDSDKNLRFADVEKPILKKGEVLVKLKAAALNHRELWIAKGLYPGMKLPCILGADGAGILEEVGDGVDAGLKGSEVIIYPAFDWGGDPEIPHRSFRVLGMPESGTMAEYIAVPYQNVIKKPNYLSWTDAAAIPVAGLTAWRALSTLAKLKKGDNILITGIGGGVAQAGLTFALSFGARVFVTSSSAVKIQDALNRGAIAGVNYKNENWNEQLKELSGGIDIILDSSPAQNLDDYLKFLNRGARIVAYGSTGSRNTTLNISKFFLRHIQFIGTAMGNPTEFSEMIDFMDRHKIKPTIYKIFPFENSLDAFDALAEGSQIGKIAIEM